jgi:hypothetical protein
MQGIVHFSFKNEKNNQLFDELLGGKEAVLGEAVCFMSCDELMLWFPLMLPTILKQKNPRLFKPWVFCCQNKNLSIALCLHEFHGIGLQYTCLC